MNAVHQLYISAPCPVDQKLDYYEVTIEVERLVRVETILAAVARVTAAKPGGIYQEDLTHELQRELGACVSTLGWHSGVRTVVRCGR